MSTTVGPRLAIEQWPTALAMAAGVAWSLLPHTLRDRVQGTDRVHTARVDPGSDASAGDGRDSFRLTGDVNPIHTSRTFARRTRFGGPLLHGFGTLAHSQELLVDVLGPPSELDIRFVAPVPLPTTPSWWSSPATPTGA